jgi:hypothetical protein
MNDNPSVCDAKVRLAAVATKLDQCTITAFYAQASDEGHLQAILST